MRREAKSSFNDLLEEMQQIAQLWLMTFMPQQSCYCEHSKTENVKSQVDKKQEYTQDVHVVDEHLVDPLTSHFTREMDGLLAQKVEVITTYIHESKESSHVVISANGNNLDFLYNNFNLVPNNVNINYSQEDGTCEFFNPYGYEENCLADNVHVEIMTYIKKFEPTIFGLPGCFEFIPFMVDLLIEIKIVVLRLVKPSLEAANQEFIGIKATKFI